MGPPNTASCASPEPPDTPCGVAATWVDREPDHGICVGRALARRASRGIPRSLPTGVGACVGHPPCGGGRPRTFETTDSTSGGQVHIAGFRQRAHRTWIPKDPRGCSRAVLATSGRLADPRAPRTTIAGSSPGGFGRRPSSMGFLALRRMRRGAATHAGIASPGYAASTDFLSPPTHCSAPNLSGLVSCR